MADDDRSDNLSDLNRRTTPDEAAKLLLEATTPLATGVTQMLGGATGEEKRFAGLACLSDDYEYSEIVRERAEKGETPEGTDNETRWTLLDNDKNATIIFEMNEIQPRYVEKKLKDRGRTGINFDMKVRCVIAFDYPEDREALVIAAETGWMALMVGTEPQRDGSVLGIELSTHGQIAKILDIMDERNKGMKLASSEEIIRRTLAKKRDPSAPEDQEWWPDWEALGETNRDRLSAALHDHPRPLSAAQSIFEQMALHRTLGTADGPLSTQRIALRVDMPFEKVQAALHATMQSDSPWAWGRTRPGTDTWEWVKDASSGVGDDIQTEWRGHDLMTAEGRTKAARLLLAEIGVEIPPEELSPAIGVMERAVTELDFQNALSLVINNHIVWASARGFTKSMDEVKFRARTARKLGVNHTDDLTMLHLQAGVTMMESHVVVFDSEQIIALPPLSREESVQIGTESPLPFDQIYMDFTGDDQLPSLHSDLDRSGMISIIGAQIHKSAAPDENVLFVSPWFYYRGGTEHASAVCLGSVAFNRSGIRDAPFHYILGNKVRFEGGINQATIIAKTDVLQNYPELREAYGEAIERGSALALSCLYLLESANVELVERPLERRDKKRADKRNWNIPLVIRVDRPARRVRTDTNGNGNGEPREFSHQFDVIGSYHHVKKGASARCIVCKGDPGQLGCTRCNNTGLDPEKTKPCARIDEATGEKTCPDGCRRIWHPPHVKGPEDAPYIPKTRKVS